MNKETIYDEKIAPLMTQIIAICEEHDIAMYATYLLNEDLACSTEHRASSGDITL